MSLFLLSVGLVYAIKTPVFQTWIVQRAASYLSSELNTTVTLDRIEIEFFRTLSIKAFTLKIYSMTPYSMREK
ncbi:MAG: hypothetical protein IPP71_14195 [Bacteroidetes bacterium]|nr:hypothetical protein [Bacteroidota bacterium]